MLAGAAQRFDIASRRRLDEARQRLTAQGKLLETLSHRATLERGFALVRTPDGGLKRAAEEVESGETLILQFHDGNRNAVADGSAPHPLPLPPPRRRRPTLPDPNQGALF